MIQTIKQVSESNGSSFRQLKNRHRMCLAVETNGTINPSENGALIIQSDCTALEKGQQWKLTDDHLCNQWNKCISTPLNTLPGDIARNIIQSEHQNSEHQNWKYGEKMGIVYNKGRCLSTIENSKYKGAAVQTYVCNFGLEGQIWNFVPIAVRKIRQNQISWCS